MASDDVGFSALDYVIFALLLLVSAAIGVFHGCFRKGPATSQELLVANRQMTLFPTAMSLLASFMSGITILGNPAESYQYGTMYFWAGVAYTFTVLVTAKIFVPVYVDLKITSGYEYLEKRFNKSVKVLISCVFLVQTIIYMSLVLYAPALAMNQVTGINIWILVFSIGAVCAFYTTIGGMKAVMWTDVFQIVIMLVGLLASFIMGLDQQGGIRRVFETNWIADRIEFFNFDPDPTTRHTVWSCSIGLFFNWLVIYSTNQCQVQRYLSVPNSRIAKRALYWNLLGLWAILTLTLTIGMIIFTKYKDCDPLKNGDVSSAEQLFPYFVLQTFNAAVGLPGLFLACLFSAALSTISSGLNSLSAVFLEDILRGNFAIMSKLSAKHEARISKVLCIVFAFICLAVTFVVSFLGNLLQAALSLFGVIGGPILGVYFLGLFVPFANSIGAISGTVFSLVFMLWIFIGYNAFEIKYPKKPFSVEGCSNATDLLTSAFSSTEYMITSTPKSHLAPDLTGIERFHAISYTWYGLIAVLVVLIVGIVVSLLTKPKKPGDVEPELMISFTDMIPLLPVRVKRYLHFGYKFKYDHELEDNAVHPVDVEVISNSGENKDSMILSEINKN